jgi:hypothetical protein
MGLAFKKWFISGEYDLNREQKDFWSIEGCGLNPLRMHSFHCCVILVEANV